MAQMCTQNVIVHCDTPPKETPLRWSVARRHADVVTKLYNNLVFAAESGDFDRMRSLINQGADATDKYAMIRASNNGHLRCVKLLIEHGAKPNGKALELLAQHGETWADLAGPSVE